MLSANVVFINFTCFRDSNSAFKMEGKRIDKYETKRRMKTADKINHKVKKPQKISKHASIGKNNPLRTLCILTVCISKFTAISPLHLRPRYFFTQIKYFWSKNWTCIKKIHIYFLKQRTFNYFFPYLISSYYYFQLFYFFGFSLFNIANQITLKPIPFLVHFRCHKSKRRKMNSFGQ